MENANSQVIGLCRFSYPALGGFQVEHTETAEREAYLYAPERMQERFRLFEQFTLPPLRAQSDPEFTLLVVIGPNMPRQDHARLMDNLSGLPQARVIVRAPGRHRDVMREVINEALIDSDLPSLQFRMDDDDAVSVHFVERLRKLATNARGLLRSNRQVAIDFVNGFVATPTPDGILASATFQHMWTPALALSVRPGVRHTIMNYSHARLWQNVPTLSWPEEPMFVRGHNGYNDSRQKEGVRMPKLSLLDAEGEALFRAQFHIDADNVRASFR
ncbi:putative rhamnosyl transferase [Roseovarius mucosus]|uniref:putative rhamnosyl transferase n=1 Tax=Roseovarius mucosus TaxID=215743 RepID=UPI003F707209